MCNYFSKLFVAVKEAVLRCYSAPFVCTLLALFWLLLQACCVKAKPPFVVFRDMLESTFPVQWDQHEQANGV